LLEQEQEGEEKARGSLRVVEKLMLQIEVSSHEKMKSKRQRKRLGILMLENINNGFV